MTPSLVLAASLAHATDRHPCDPDSTLQVKNTKACFCINADYPVWYAGNTTKGLAPVDTTVATSTDPYFDIDDSCFDIDPLITLVQNQDLRDRLGPEIEEKARLHAGANGHVWERLSGGGYGVRGLMSGQVPYEASKATVTGTTTPAHFRIYDGQTLLVEIVTGSFGTPFEAILLYSNDDDDLDLAIGLPGHRWVVNGPLQGQTVYPPSP